MLPAVRAGGGLTITGIVTTGRGRSSRHMRQRDYTPLGYQPIPGTLNLTTGDETARRVRHLPGGVHVQEGEDVATLHPMILRGMMVHVRAYRRGVEVVAPVRLRDTFDLHDGDTVTLRWPAAGKPSRLTGKRDDMLRRLRAKLEPATRRLHRRNAYRLLNATQWSLHRSMDLYQGGQRDIETRWEFIRAEIKRHDAGSVLDVGCAEGTFVQRAASELGCFGIGVELTRRSVLRAEVDRLAGERKGYAIIHASLDPDAIRRLPHFDVTLCLSVVHHVINKGGLDAGREFLSALASITRRAIVFEMGAPELPEFADDKGRALSADTQAPAITSLLESAGLTNIRVLGRTSGFKGRFQRDTFIAEPAQR
jgi:SAM-dependent methyltransferase